MNVAWKLSGVLLLVVGLCWLAPPGLAAPTGAEVKEDAGELLHTLKDYTVEQKDAAVRNTREALDDMDRRIDALENRAEVQFERMDRAAREQTRENLKELRQQRTRAAEWFGGLKSSSGEAWEQVKQGFAEAYRALHESWEKSSREIDAAE